MFWKFQKNRSKSKQAEKEQDKKSVFKEWLNAIIFAVIAASFIRWLVFTPYTIPTPSMEGSLLVGDFLVVSKLHYGPKTPKTPLQIPLASNFIWGTKIPSYLTWIKLPVYRIPGFAKIKNNDVVVFQFPGELQYPSDQRTPYIKRCIAIPRDTLVINDKAIFVNNKKFPIPEKMQTSFKIITKAGIKDRVFLNYDITDYYGTGFGYVVHTTKETIEQFGQLPVVENVIEIKQEKESRESNIFPQSGSHQWNGDFYGPLIIPGRGDKIPVNKKTLSIYGSTIINYEGHDQVEIIDDQLFIDGKDVKEYTFNLDYYFMMGDNRHNSLDSRYWGLVPSDHVIGKAIFTWWSVNKNKSWFNIREKIRWHKIFKRIE